MKQLMEDAFNAKLNINVTKYPEKNPPAYLNLEADMKAL